MTSHDRRAFLKRSAATVAAGPLAAGGLGSSASAQAAAANEPGAIPPHRPLDLPGLHAYSTSTSVSPGETIEFRTTSTVPYQVSIYRLGVEVDDPTSDELVAELPRAAARQQAIHPGSYIHVANGLPAEKPLGSFSLECWFKAWQANAWAGLITQHDYPKACGYGLFLNPQGQLTFYCGSGGAYDAACSCVAESPRVETGRWHHAVATWDGSEAAIWLDGKRIGAWKLAGEKRAGSSPLRLGAYGENGLADHFADVDLAMPAIYGTALGEPTIAARFAERGLRAAGGDSVFACWPLDEERGDAVHDASRHARHGRIINHGTWMIGGPSFNPNVDRYGTYDPAADERRGHGLRLASDDLYDCRWQVTESYCVPESARPGIYVARIRYELEGRPLVNHVTFFVKRTATQAPSDIVLLCATNTYRAYNSAPFAVTPEGLKQNISTHGLANSTAAAPAYSFYRGHAAGQGTYQLGLRMPWRGADPYVTYGDPKSDYSHLLRADRFTQSWLTKNNYPHDVITDLELHSDAAALDGCRVLFINGHSEYWSLPMYRAVEKFLARGGNVVCLSGNTMFWRVSWDDELTVLECRKVDAPGNQMTPEQRGECWHSQDGLRGGMLRDAGFPGWKLLALETLGWNNVQPEAFGPYVVRDADHFLFREPEPTGLAAGDTFGEASAEALPKAIGHEFDVRLSTLRSWMPAEIPAGATHPDDPAGITLLADGINHWATGGLAFDYFTRGLKPPRDLGAEMIYWERPEGGRVFNAGAIGAGWALAADPRFGRLMSNVLAHFGATREPA